MVSAQPASASSSVATTCAASSTAVAPGGERDGFGIGKARGRDEHEPGEAHRAASRARPRRCCPDGSCATSTMRTRGRARSRRRGIGGTPAAALATALRPATVTMRCLSFVQLRPAGIRGTTGATSLRTMHPMLTIAVKAARRAGNIINRGARDLDLLTVTSKGPKDFVSEVDREAEASDRRDAARALSGPRDSSRGRHRPEARTPTPKTSGSSIRSTARRTSCTAFRSTACRSRWRTRGLITQGVIYDPVRNDLFTATRGRGAFLNDRRIRVSRAPASARLPDRHRLSVSRRQLPRHLPADDEDDDRADRRAAPARRGGARSRLRRRRLLRRILRGRPQPWDVAAGSLLVLEAGGLIGDLARRGRLPARRTGDRRHAEDLRADGAGAGAVSRGACARRAVDSVPLRRAVGTPRYDAARAVGIVAPARAHLRPARPVAHSLSRA